MGIMNVAIFGAGSIGNHLAYSARKREWQVSVFDNDQAALSRFKEEIYPSRYGAFDSEIKLYNSENFSSLKESFDVVLIGTPPDTHLEILNKVVKKEPKVVYIEKPICPPVESQIFSTKEIILNNSDIRFLGGYNHRLSLIIQNLLNLIITQEDDIQDLEVNWLESWDGIMKAHPWISSPLDTYLGNTNRGGGALFEHSHGIDLWMTLARSLGKGNPINVKGKLEGVQDSSGALQYDQRVFVEITTENGFTGRVEQDVTTTSVHKTIKITGNRNEYLASFSKNGFDELVCSPIGDFKGGFEMKVKKPRPSDFDPSIHYIEMLLSDNQHKGNTLELDALSALFTSYVSMEVIKSSMSHESVNINLEKWKGLLND
jgi:predicted dehydrogenase